MSETRAVAEPGFGPGDRGPALGGTGWLITLGLLTALGLALRLVRLGDSLFGDELSTLVGARLAAGPGDVVDLISADTIVIELTPPLYFILAWVSTELGDAVELVRLPALIAGTLLIPATYSLGARTVGRGAGLIASALVAIAPFTVFYSTDGRAYMLAALLVAVAALALLRASDDGSRRWWWAGYALASCAAVYTHYTSVFPLLVLAAWALWARRKAWRELLAANAAAAIGFLPWVPEYLDDGRSQVNLIEVVHPFGLGTLLDDLGTWSLGMPPYAGLGDVPGMPALVIVTVGFAVAAIGLSLRVLSPRALAERPRPSAELLLVIGLALAAPVGMSLYSALGDDILLERGLAVSWPGLAVAAGALLQSARPPADVVAVVLVAAGVTLGTINSFDREVARPDYKGAAEFVRSRVTPADPVFDLDPIKSVGAFGASAHPLSNALAVQLPDRRVRHPRDLADAAGRTGADRIAVVVRDDSEIDVPALDCYVLIDSTQFEGSFALTASIFRRSCRGD